MKCLAATQGPKVRVNAIAPGLLLTEWVNSGIWRAVPVADEQKGGRVWSGSNQGHTEQSYLEERGMKYP